MSEWKCEWCEIKMLSFAIKLCLLDIAIKLADFCRIVSHCFVSLLDINIFQSVVQSLNTKWLRHEYETIWFRRLSLRYILEATKIFCNYLYGIKMWNWNDFIWFKMSKNVHSAPHGCSIVSCLLFTFTHQHGITNHVRNWLMYT